MTDPLLTPAQVAEQCQVSRDAVYRAIRRGDLRAVKAFGGRLRIFGSELASYLERGRVEPVAPPEVADPAFTVPVRGAARDTLARLQAIEAEAIS